MSSTIIMLLPFLPYEIVNKRTSFRLLQENYLLRNQPYIWYVSNSLRFPIEATAQDLMFK